MIDSEDGDEMFRQILKQNNLEKLGNTLPISAEHATLEVEISADVTMIHGILEGIRATLEHADLNLDFEIFMQTLGESIAWEYMHSDVEYDEPTSDVATWFLP